MRQLTSFSLCLSLLCCASPAHSQASPDSAPLGSSFEWFMRGDLIYQGEQFADGTFGFATPFFPFRYSVSHPRRQQLGLTAQVKF